MQKWEYKVTRHVCALFSYEDYEEEHIEEKKAFGWDEEKGWLNTPDFIIQSSKWNRVLDVAWNDHLKEMEYDLNRMGNEGWELVHDHRNVMKRFETLQYWKRPIKED
jgi:hypothetical protein